MQGFHGLQADVHGAIDRRAGRRQDAAHDKRLVVVPVQVQRAAAMREHDRVAQTVTQRLFNRIGREIQPFVLLMDHNEEHGFLRHWVPTEFGPGKHFGYALQWFAMGLVLGGLLIWNYRKKRFHE